MPHPPCEIVRPTIQRPMPHSLSETIACQILRENGSGDPLVHSGLGDLCRQINRGIEASGYECRPRSVRLHELQSVRQREFCFGMAVVATLLAGWIVCEQIDRWLRPPVPQWTKDQMIGQPWTVLPPLDTEKIP